MHHQLTIKAALSVDEFCSAISLKRTSVYQRIALGQIKILKVGRRTLIPVEEVQAFLERARSGSL